MERDRISDLPSDVIDQILSKLPITDMVKTSVLSTEWRYRWASVKNLVINLNSFPRSDNKVKNITCMILLLHMGPIHKFKLSYKDNLPIEEIDKWIFYLSKSSVKEFVFDMTYPSMHYRIPFCLFSCQSLTHLELGHCHMSLPSKFKGFENLKNLNLERVVTTQQVLETLIYNSHVLETLILMYVDDVDQLNIHGPNLIFFEMRAKFVNVCFKNASRLREVNIAEMLYNETYASGNPDKHGDLLKLMASIPEINRLTLEGCAIEYLGAGNIPRKLPVPCITLTNLRLLLPLFKIDELPAFNCLLRSAPNLEDLRINFYGHIYRAPSRNTWKWDADSWECPFTKLRVVRLISFIGVHYEMEFLKFLLLTSPALVSITIELSVCDYRSEMWEKMTCFKRASPKAEIRVFYLNREIRVY